MITALQVCGLSVFAEQETADTLRHVDLDEVQVIATRATAHTPIAFVNMDKETIRKQNAGLDVPFLLTMTCRYSGGQGLPPTEPELSAGALTCRRRVRQLLPMRN